MHDPVIALRRALHRHPELSGDESHTAQRSARFFEPLAPDALLEHLGGTGLAVVFAGRDRARPCSGAANRLGVPPEAFGHLWPRVPEAQRARVTALEVDFAATEFPPCDLVNVSFDALRNPKHWQIFHVVARKR